MKLSQSFFQTYKDNPSEAEVISHKLMLRAGLIHKISSGMYAYLPVGLKVLRKVENVIRKELDNIGAQEIEIPVVSPSDLWKESGRWDQYGDLMLKAVDRNKRTLCLSPTNEESITDIFRKTIKSYKELPINLFQINTKFRDELRPRFGLLRCREFLMMDSYSFHVDYDCLNSTYNIMFECYNNIFSSLGLETMPVVADAGNIGEAGAKTHEFHVLADSGEDDLVICKKCMEAVNLELSSTTKKIELNPENKGELKKVSTKNMKKISEVCNFLNVLEANSIKSIALMIEEEKDKWSPLIVYLRGDDDLNENKLLKIKSVEKIRMMTNAEMEKYNLIEGYIVPLENSHREITELYDLSINESEKFLVGANESNFHFTNFTINKNIKREDLRVSRPEDLCSKCKEPIIFKKGIEVGHIFQLRDKYTKSLNAKILDKSGKRVTPEMGCYGIGVSRIIAAAIEQSHDEKGIIWPKEITPFHVSIIVLSKDKHVMEKAVAFYDEIKNNGYDVILDDRKNSPGFKFKDFELLGIPMAFVFSDKLEKDEKVEVIFRKEAKKDIISNKLIVDIVRKFYV